MSGGVIGVGIVLVVDMTLMIAILGGWFILFFRLKLELVHVSF